MKRNQTRLSSLNYEAFDKLTNQFTDEQIGKYLETTKNKVTYYRRKLGIRSKREKHRIFIRKPI